MELQLPAALELFLYVGSISMIALAAILIVLLLRFRGQVERVVRAVEELKGDLGPLAHETRAMVDGLRDLSGRLQRQWSEVERIVSKARAWSERASHLVEEVGAIVEPPLFGASRNLRLLKNGLWTFVMALIRPTPEDGRRSPPQEEAQEKARAS